MKKQRIYYSVLVVVRLGFLFWGIFRPDPAGFGLVGHQTEHGLYTAPETFIKTTGAERAQPDVGYQSWFRELNRDLLNCYLNSHLNNKN